MLSITKYIYVVLHSETIEVIVQLIKSLTTQVKVLTGIGGISSSCGRGTVATNPQRQSKEARINFIFPKLGLLQQQLTSPGWAAGERLADVAGPAWLIHLSYTLLYQPACCLIIFGSKRPVVAKTTDLSAATIYRCLVRTKGAQHCQSQNSSI